MILLVVPVLEGWRMVVLCDATASVDCAGTFETMQPTANACHRALAEARWKRGVSLPNNPNGDACPKCRPSAT